MQIHAAMVDRMDQNIGRLAERLKKPKNSKIPSFFFSLIMEQVMRDQKEDTKTITQNGEVLAPLRR